MRRVLFLALAMLAVARVAEAQQAPAPKPYEDVRLIFVSGQYGTPLRTSGSVAVFLQRPNPTRNPLMEGWLVEAGAGQGGARVSAGHARFLEYTGLDARAVLTRTFASSSVRGATPRATYGGFEAGLTIWYVRVSAGVARRLAGAGGEKGTIFTWSGAIQIPIK